MNQVHIIGNLIANPESRIVTVRNGMNTVCNFTVAVNRWVHGQIVTDYFRITLWNKLADSAMKFLTKGRQVSVTGPVTASAYMGRDDKPHCRMEIQDVQDIEYLGSRPNGSAAPEEAYPTPEEYAPVDDPDVPWG